MSVTYNSTPTKRQGTGSYTVIRQKEKLPYDTTFTEDEVRKIEATQDYIDFTNYALNEFTNNPTGEWAKEYTNYFLQNLKDTNPQAFDENGNYIGTNSVLKKTSNGQYQINPEQWKIARGDGKWGFIHDFALTKTPPIKEPKIPEEKPPTGIVPPKYDNPFDPSLDISLGKPEHIPWTDWIPHTMQLINAHTTNNKLARLQKQMSFPRRMAPQKNAIITDAYAQRQLLEKQKQELLARADNTQVSNMDQKMAIMRQAEEQAGKYNDAQSQLQAQEYAQTKKDVNDVANWNLVQRAEVANHKAKVNSAAYNNWLNAESQRLTSNAAARKSYLYDMYKDYGLYKQDQRFNDRAYKDSQLKLQLSDKLTQLSNIYSQQADPATWRLLSQYAVELARNPESGLSDSDIQLINQNSGNSEKVIEVLKNNARFRNLIVAKLQTGNDETSKSYRAAYESDKARLDKDYDNAYNAAYRQYEGARSALPATVSNQIFDRGLFKKGGKLSVLKEVVKQNQREKESNRKASEQFHKRTSKELARQLGALDKEQLMLLKSIFS